MLRIRRITFFNLRRRVKSPIVSSYCKDKAIYCGLCSKVSLNTAIEGWYWPVRVRVDKQGLLIHHFTASRFTQQRFQHRNKNTKERTFETVKEEKTCNIKNIKPLGFVLLSVVWLFFCVCTYCTVLYILCIYGGSMTHKNHENWSPLVKWAEGEKAPTTSFLYFVLVFVLCITIYFSWTLRRTVILRWGCEKFWCTHRELFKYIFWVPLHHHSYPLENICTGFNNS